MIIYSLAPQNNELFSSQAVLDDLTDYLNTTLAVLLTEEIQCNHIKELQVCEELFSMDRKHLLCLSRTPSI